MSSTRLKYYDNHTLYVTSGVAREEQLYKSLRAAIASGEENIYNENLEDFIYALGLDLLTDLPPYDTIKDKNLAIVEKLTELGHTAPQKLTLDCKIKVNLIVNKNGDYYGFGYIHISNEEVYWMLLGKNPDGTDRVLEYLDPIWVPPQPKPVLSEEEERERYSSMKWYEIAEEEDKYVHPVIKQVLEPLMVIPGYRYDDMQYKHHQEIAVKEGKDPASVPEMGYFELSRAYTRDVNLGKISNVLCARQVPDWIPAIAFKRIFNDYALANINKNGDTKNNNTNTTEGDNTTKGDNTSNDNNTEGDNTKGDNDNNNTEGNNTNNNNTEGNMYPIVKLIDGKAGGGKIVFVSFEPDTKDAIFALLMTRKVHIVHPKNPKLRCTLIFDHAYEKSKNDGNQNNRYNNRYDNNSNNNKYSNNTRTGNYNNKYDNNKYGNNKFSNYNNGAGNNKFSNYNNRANTYNRTNDRTANNHRDHPGNTRQFSNTRDDRPKQRPHDDIDMKLKLIVKITRKKLFLYFSSR